MLTTQIKIIFPSKITRNVSIAARGVLLGNENSFPFLANPLQRGVRVDASWVEVPPLDYPDPRPRQEVLLAAQSVQLLHCVHI